MNRFLIRFIVIVLIPCLVIDPTLAADFLPYSFRNQTHLGTSFGLFQEQALIAHLVGGWARTHNDESADIWLRKKRKAFDVHPSIAPSANFQLVIGLEFVLFIMNHVASYYGHGFLNFDQSYSLYAMSILGPWRNPFKNRQLDRLFREDASGDWGAFRKLLDAIDATDIPYLIRKLQDPNPKIRAQVAHFLGHLKALQAEPALLPLLNDPERNVRKEAAVLLAQSKNRVALPVLEECLPYEYSFSHHVEDSLKQFDLDDSEWIRLWISVLQNREGELSQQKKAIGQLAQLHAAEAVGPLIAVYEDDTAHLWDESAEALGEIGDDRAIEPLIKRLGSSGLGSTPTAKALIQLGHRDQAQRILASNLLHAESEFQRSQAAEALGEAGFEEAAPSLITALEDPAASVREGAEKALITIGFSDWGNLWHRLASSERPEARRRAIEAETALGIPFVRLGERVLNDADVATRSTAAKVLSESEGTPDEWIDFCRAALLSDFPDVRFYGVARLGHLTDSQGVTLLLSKLDDQDTKVRIKAIKTLAEKKAREAFHPFLARLRDIRADRDMGTMDSYKEQQALLNALRTLGLDRSAWEEAIYQDAYGSIAIYVVGQLKQKELVPVLISDVISNPTSPRCYAEISALGATGDPRAVEPLVALLNSTHYILYPIVATALVQLDSAQEGIIPLREHLGDPSPKVRVATVQAFGNLGQSEAIEDLKRSIKDPDHEVRVSSYGALKNLKFENWNEVASVIDDSNPGITEDAIDGMKSVAAENNEVLWRLAILSIDNRVQRDIHDKAEAALRYHNGFYQVLPREKWIEAWEGVILHCTVQAERRKSLAIAQLARQGGPAVVIPLIHALADESQTVQVAAQEVLSDLVLKPEERRAAYIEALENPLDATRRQAARLLGTLGDREATPVLITRLEDAAIRIEVIEALGQIGDLAALQSLQRYTREREENIRQAAIAATVAIRRKEHNVLLRAADSPPTTETLLRPAQGRPETPDEQLLRPTGEDPDDTRRTLVSDKTLDHFGLTRKQFHDLSRGRQIAIGWAAGPLEIIDAIFTPKSFVEKEHGQQTPSERRWRWIGVFALYAALAAGLIVGVYFGWNISNPHYALAYRIANAVLAGISASLIGHIIVHGIWNTAAAFGLVPALINSADEPDEFKRAMELAFQSGSGSIFALAKRRTVQEQERLIRFLIDQSQQPGTPSEINRSRMAIQTALKDLAANNLGGTAWPEAVPFCLQHFLSPSPVIRQNAEQTIMIIHTQRWAPQALSLAEGNLRRLQDSQDVRARQAKTLLDRMLQLGITSSSEGVDDLLQRLQSSDPYVMIESQNALVTAIQAGQWTSALSPTIPLLADRLFHANQQVRLSASLALIALLQIPNALEAQHFLIIHHHLEAYSYPQHYEMHKGLASRLAELQAFLNAAMQADAVVSEMSELVIFLTQLTKTKNSSIPQAMVGELAKQPHAQRVVSPALPLILQQLAFHEGYASRGWETICDSLRPHYDSSTQRLIHDAIEQHYQLYRLEKRFRDETEVHVSIDAQQFYRVGQENALAMIPIYRELAVLDKRVAQVYFQRYGLEFNLPIDRIRTAYSVLTLHTTDRNREFIVNAVFTAQHIDWFQQPGVDIVRHCEFYDRVIALTSRMALQALDGIMEALEKEIIPLALSQVDQNAVLEYIGRYKNFEPNLYLLYQEQGPAAIDSLQPLINRILIDRVRTRELTGFITPSKSLSLLSSVLQLAIPASGVSFISKNQVIGWLERLLAIGDLRSHIPNALRNRDFGNGASISFVVWRLRSGEVFDPEGYIHHLLESLRYQKEAISEEQQKKEALEDERQWREALTTYLRAGRPIDQRSGVLEAFYKSIRHSDQLGEKVDRLQLEEYGGLLLLEQLFVDREHLRGVVETTLHDLFEADSSLIPYVKNPSARPIARINALIAQLEGPEATTGLWGTHHSDRETRTRALLQNVSSTDLLEQLLPRLHQEELRTFVTALAEEAPPPVALKPMEITRELWEEPLRRLTTEKNKFESRNAEETIDLEFRVVKGIPYGLWGLNAGVCIAMDEDLWKDPRFFLVAIIDKGSRQVVGFVHLFQETINGQRILFVPGIEPSVEFLAHVQARDVYPLIEQALVRIAQRGGYDALDLPSNPTILSNRSDIVHEAQKRRYPEVTLSTMIDWSRRPAYPFNQVYRMWARPRRASKPTTVLQPAPGNPASGIVNLFVITITTLWDRFVYIVTEPVNILIALRDQNNLSYSALGPSTHQLRVAS